MPVHFAAARSTAHSPIARALARKAHSRAANDNAGAAQMVATASPIDGVMHAALKHFANHGLSAAKVAAQQAEHAHAADDPESYDWWLGICRTLDRGLARRLDEQLAIKSLLASISPV